MISLPKALEGGRVKNGLELYAVPQGDSFLFEVSTRMRGHEFKTVQASIPIRLADRLHRPGLFCLLFLTEKKLGVHL